MNIKSNNEEKVPIYSTFFEPIVKALRELGGSATIAEIDEKVGERMKLSERQLELPQKYKNESYKSYETMFEYRMAWARHYLKVFGLIANSSRGVWSLTEKGRTIDKVDTQEINRYVRISRKGKKGLQTPEPDGRDDSPVDQVWDGNRWRSELLRILTEELSPPAFERLAQRVLRESGFIKVEVTGKTGDGGIDGKGIARIHGMMSFHVMFQCKRYKHSVTAGEIRDFRGALVGRGDKGLFITTGKFTKDALKEATRDGASPIDLLDGDELADKLKELGLGVKTEMVEQVNLDEDWFKSL